MLNVYLILKSDYGKKYRGSLPTTKVSNCCLSLSMINLITEGH